MTDPEAGFRGPGDAVLLDLDASCTGVFVSENSVSYNRIRVLFWSIILQLKVKIANGLVPYHVPGIVLHCCPVIPVDTVLGRPGAPQE